ncbi:DUF547 domain-containing protein [Chromatocurvus halotolerans]|uniref:Uncharacterized protein DUF547 n=1 Tax=Chromatocurvus halotolerans TaxID=1132028 RepID=A0A4R2KVA1_9GAMM|nr:DUF547 domain-containing protein [Chromatocurvus halotolerans]TCO77854.1 uncharacterized protein DUF547 [Chromatocurvus halotolerans]
MKLLRLATLLTCLTFTSGAGAFDHSEWNRLLGRFVSATENGDSTTIDYAGVQGQRGRLRSYLDRLSDVEAETFAAWRESERLAFLINAYNAWTVELILGEYPDIASIRDIGGWFGSPWKKSIAPLLGEKRTLDEIEHKMIRGSGESDEPRIHFAVNCASIGCPALRSEAYVADKLDAQLEAQTRDFLKDRSRNRWRDGRLYVSPIFKWYREDFETGWRGTHSLAGFLVRYADALKLSADQTEALHAGSVEIRYTDYDWRLNDSRPPDE